MQSKASTKVWCLSGTTLTLPIKSVKTWNTKPNNFLIRSITMNIYKELAQVVVDKYPNTYCENYYDYIVDEYPYASDELVDDIFEAALQIEGV